MRKTVFSALALAMAGTVAVASTVAAASAASGLGNLDAARVSAGPAVTDGSWSAPFQPAGSKSRVVGVHTVMLYTGKVLTFGALKPTVGYVYDPVTGTATVTNPPVDVECGAMATLEDGRVLIVGGHGYGAKGLDNIFLFDPITLTWTAQPPSPRGRYYPTATRLPNGQVLISGGFTLTGGDNTDVEVWTPPTGGGSVGTLRNVGQHLGGLYPHQWVLPNGNVLEITSRSASLLDTTTWVWTKLPKPITKHYSGEGAFLLPGPTTGSTTAAIVGGVQGSTAVSGMESYNATTNTWTKLASMPQPRAHMTPILLPDGSTLALAGNQIGNFDGAQYTTLRYVPGATSWATLAPQAERRGYHSSGVLLPDGRVFSAGDTGPSGGGNTDEIYSPAYLFQGARPSITSVPTQVAHGASFTITTPDTATHAVLMEPGAATHTVDFSERNIAVQTSPDGHGGLTATAPGNTVALTGYYMLFLVDANGVPSTAKWIHIG
jgi:Domain of unknown function (DUF1929)/Kelch motif